MKLIHISDLRLNSACESFGSLADMRKEELWDTLGEICRACNNRQVGLLLLSGNIFDREPSFIEMDRLALYFRSLLNTAVVWIAGYRDYIRSGNSFVNYKWPENVNILKGAERIHLPALNCYVTGVSYKDGKVEDDVLDYLKTDKQDSIQILMMNGDEEHLGYRHEKLAAKGFDYVALGGKQNFSIWEHERLAYSGSPEPLDETGTGNHGYIYAEVEKGTASIQLIDIARRHFKLDMLYLNEDMTLSDIRKSWKQKAENAFYKLSVRGKLPGGVTLDDLKTLDGVVEVIDDTELSVDVQALKNAHKNDILGAFIESMEVSDEKLRKRAMELGIAALLRGENL